MWTNETMAGAWQLAPGFAMLGEPGAIYFTAYNRRPVIAGLFFALAFGNRTEIILTAPIFFSLIWRDFGEAEKKTKNQKPKTEKEIANRQLQIANLAKFCLVPFILGISTLIYNYLRFDSFFDFGYARIPGVLMSLGIGTAFFRFGIFPIRRIRCF